MKELPKKGDIITVTDPTVSSSFRMIGKVVNPYDESYSNIDNYRGTAKFIWFDDYGNNYVYYSKEESWCYGGTGLRQFRKATKHEIRWFNLCKKKGSYVEPPSKFYTVSDFIKWKN